jgi:hypothetical protein
MLSPKIHIICIGIQCILKLGILGLKSTDLGILGLSEEYRFGHPGPEEH